jgi:hypothetical protein
MKISCPEAWLRAPGVDYGASSISLNANSPKPGQPASVVFALADRSRVGDVVTLLYGWSEQPSEIAKSLLVTAKVVRVALVGLAE